MGRPGGAGTRAEDDVLTVLRGQLDRSEILLTSVRITDPREGDVEADMIVLFPDLGAAVIEVKGGLVEYSAGEWTTSRGSYRRRIHPIEQARKAKHALRRYLDRQPEWSHPLLRTAWFVVVPQTPLTGDLGPEGNRDHLIGQGELGLLREQIRAVLGSSLNTDPIPSPGWEQEALALLLRTTTTPVPRRRRRATLVSIAGTLVVLGGLVWWLISGTASAPASPPADGAVVPATGVVTGECHPGYEPCLPVTDDLDCSDIRVAVTVRGKDVYGLDRDGDGQACEVYQ